MSKARLIALAGPLTTLVGLMWLAWSLGDFVLHAGVANADMVVALLSIPFFLSFIPLLFALIGARLRYHERASALGRFGLALGVAGCAGVIIAVLAQPLLSALAAEAQPPRGVSYAALACFLSIRIGYMLFGADALRRRLLPRWNLLPLLLGATVVLGLPFDWFGAPALLPGQWSTPLLHFAAAGACWVLLGIAMLEQRPEPQPTAAL